MTNANRTDRIFRAMMSQYDFLECPADAITDALSDLRHLADEYGVNWHDVDRIASDHYGQDIAP
jgi:hypothetical protein